MNFYHPLEVKGSIVIHPKDAMFIQSEFVRRHFIARISVLVKKENHIELVAVYNKDYIDLQKHPDTTIISDQDSKMIERINIYPILVKELFPHILDIHVLDINKNPLHLVMKRLWHEYFQNQFKFDFNKNFHGHINKIPPYPQSKIKSEITSQSLFQSLATTLLKPIKKIKAFLTKFN